MHLLFLFGLEVWFRSNDSLGTFSTQKIASYITENVRKRPFSLYDPGGFDSLFSFLFLRLKQKKHFTDDKTKPGVKHGV